MYGLPGLLCTLSASLSEDSAPLEVYGPLGLRQFVRVALNLARSQLCYPYVVHELCHNVNPADHDGLVSIGLVCASNDHNFVNVLSTKLCIYIY